MFEQASRFDKPENATYGWLEGFSPLGSVMRLRLRGLCLLLTLFIAWTCDLQAKALALDIPAASPSSSLQEVYPLSRFYQAEIRERIEVPATVTPLLLEESSPPLPAAYSPQIYPEAKPRVLSSADACYLYMSLQW